MWVRFNYSELEEFIKLIVVKEKFKLGVIKVVVVDFGIGYCKCGFVGLLKFIYNVLSIVGKFYMEIVKIGDNRKEIYVG